MYLEDPLAVGRPQPGGERGQDHRENAKGEGVLHARHPLPLACRPLQARAGAAVDVV